MKNNIGLFDQVQLMSQDCSPSKKKEKDKEKDKEKESQEVN